MSRHKVVALVLWKWDGHHPMYFKLQLRALLELGCTVAAFCPEPEEVRSSLQDLDQATLSRLTLQALEWQLPPKRCPAILRRRISTISSVRTLTKLIHQWESEHGKQVDLVFFSSIYDDHFPIYGEAEWFFPFSWSALFIYSQVFRVMLSRWSDGAVPRRVGKTLYRYSQIVRGKLGKPLNDAVPWRVEAIFRSPKLLSVGMLDEDVKDLVEQRYGRTVVCFPDLTDDAVDESSQIANDLRRFAAGRPIIASLGFLKPSKGILTLAKLALDPANHDLCFAFIGEAPWDIYGPEEKEVVLKLADKRPNVFTHLDRINDERAFNSCIKACDVVFAAYLNFAQSSGILTKAAAFKKPVIVSDGFLMARRVRQFQIGAVIPEGDEGAAIRAIREILFAGNDSATNAPNWEGYTLRHSFERLREAFAEVLAAS